MHEFPGKNKMTLISHPPYSPDLAPCNFFLSAKLKMALKGGRFNDTTMIEA
jgi:hypothetical protein